MLEYRHISNRFLNIIFLFYEKFFKYTHCEVFHVSSGKLTDNGVIVPSVKMTSHYCGNPSSPVILEAEKSRREQQWAPLTAVLGSVSVQKMDHCGHVLSADYTELG